MSSSPEIILNKEETDALLTLRAALPDFTLLPIDEPFFHCRNGRLSFFGKGIARLRDFLQQLTATDTPRTTHLLEDQLFAKLKNLPT